MPPKKDPTPIYIEGPKMDWAMAEGLYTQYELFKQLCQDTTPCDDWYTRVQNQLTMCNYKPDMESVLQHNIFLFGLNDQAFISKIISEESPDVTAATIQQKLKKLEAGRATAKYIKGTNATGKDPNAEGVNQVQKQGNPKAKVHKRKGWHKDSQSHPAKKPFKPNPQQR